ncbi:MAG: TIGR00299 family protein [Desulfuromonas sp.]|nr:MAG: TIGR00299 family protein [Desulfuromonas sp.]
MAGVSGDMFLGMLLDLGVPLSVMTEALDTLDLDGWQLAQQREKRRAIEGTRALVNVEETHHHRTWQTIDSLLASSALAEAPRTLARRIFRKLGEAEASVHGIPLESVHFHEVGALDAIIDIVGSAVGLCHLAPHQVICGPLPAATGTIATAHGTYPLPAPATLRLLEGWPLRNAPENLEWVTPTGAAIVAAVATPGPLPEMTLLKSGYGVGGRDPESIPNLLRGLLGQGSGNGDMDQVTVLESHLDDSRPEWLGALLERLMAAGALDAGFTPLQMKKNRPGIRLTVIAATADAERLSQLLLRESSAIGVRSYTSLRRKLRRKNATVRTPLGEAAVKLIYEGDALVRITAEYDDCLRLSSEENLSLPEVYRIVEQAAALHFQTGETPE